MSQYSTATFQRKKKNDHTLYQMVDKQNTPVSNGKVQLP